MNLHRLILGFAAVASLASLSVASVACSGGTTGPEGASGANSGAGMTAALDGAWDITAAGDGEIGPSEMTISNGVVTGVITSKSEGRSASGGGATCKKIKDRAEFKLNFEGNSLSGTVTTLVEYEGSSCPEPRTRTFAMTGSRAAANAGTGLTGEWEVQIDDENPFVVNVDGLTAKAWDKQGKLRGKDPVASVSVAGGSATVASSDDDLTFAARKR